jgi:hypothetical protein
MEFGGEVFLVVESNGGVDLLLLLLLLLEVLVWFDRIGDDNLVVDDCFGVDDDGIVVAFRTSLIGIGCTPPVRTESGSMSAGEALGGEAERGVCGDEPFTLGDKPFTKTR